MKIVREKASLTDGKDKLVTLRGMLACTSKVIDGGVGLQLLVLTSCRLVDGERFENDS